MAPARDARGEDLIAGSGSLLRVRAAPEADEGLGRAINDRLRRAATLERKAAILDSLATQDELKMDDSIPDDRLKLMFTCCHPSLALEAQVALTLHTLGGLSTQEVARAFLVPVPTMAQRLARLQGVARSGPVAPSRPG